MTATAPAWAEEQQLQLEVFINAVPTGLIGAFVLHDDGRISAETAELDELGLDVSTLGGGGGPVLLDAFPGLSYAYDAPTQTIAITLADSQRKEQSFDVAYGLKDPFEPAAAGWGAVMNYDLLATSGSLSEGAPFATSASTMSGFGRVFSPYGTFEQSGVLGWSAGQTPTLTRLDTSFRVSNQASMTTYQAGDVITGGLPWSRPIRILGLQAQSNFALRPDLITSPMLAVGGTAAVPSTVDVYVNNAKAHSTEVGPGPFTFNNIPVLTGPGDVKLVVRDPSGREEEITVPFYASSALLTPGLNEWSAEAGLPRLAYGSEQDHYQLQPVASATFRRGILDWLTAELHGEFGAGVANAGIGTVFSTGPYGLATASLSASQSGYGTGAQASVSYETSLLGMTITAGMLRTFGDYEDLASATAIPDLTDPSTPRVGFGGSREMDRIMLSAPIALEWRPTVGVSYLGTVDPTGQRSESINLSYSQILPFGGSLYANAFRTYSDTENTGFSIGISMPLDGDITMSSNLSAGSSSGSASIDLMKPLEPTPGSTGWRIRDHEGATSHREASVSHRSSFGTAQLGVSQIGPSFSGSLSLRGAVAAMDGGVFLSDWINDSFAVVNTGLPGVEVLYENRVVGMTDAQGKILLPTLNSYERNKITIDPTSLPVDSEIAVTQEIVAPMDRAGVSIDFEVTSSANAALVTFVMDDGSFVPAGAAGQLGAENSFTVGYDGQAFIRDLGSDNEVTIEFLEGRCSAKFEFAPSPGAQVQIGPVTCL